MRTLILLFTLLFSWFSYASEDDISQCCSLYRVVGKCENVNLSRCKDLDCVKKRCASYVDDYQQFCKHAKHREYRCDSLSTQCEPIC